VLQDVAPEAGELVAVADLENVELLLHALVQLELLGLEHWQGVFAEVDRQEIHQRLACHDVLLKLVDLAFKLGHVILVFQRGAKSLVASVQIINILLGGRLLLLERKQVFFDLMARADSVDQSLNVVELTLDPVIDVDKAVSEVAVGVGHALLEAAVVGVVEHQRARLIVHVLVQVEVLVELHDLLKALVGAEDVRLVREHCGQV
jgi:hypothetical protein